MKQSMFEESVRTPLILAAPNTKAKGRATSRIVELLDIYPTLADLCKRPAPLHLEGKSLKPLLDNPQAKWDQPAYSQVDRGPANQRFTGRSVRTERWRYTEWDGGKQGAELSDHVNDPHEYHNLATAPAAEKTRTALQQLLRTGPAAPGKGNGIE